MRVLFSSTWGHGHVFPMVPLARAFLAAGHQVRWAASGSAARLVTAAGVDAVAAGLDGPGVVAVEGRLAAAMADVPPQGRGGFAFPTMFAGWAAPVMAPDLLTVATEWRPDLMVHEHAELAAPLVGALLGVPVVTHSFGGGIPAGFLVAAGERLAGMWADHGREIPTYAGCFADGYLDICPPPVQTVALGHVPLRLPLQPGGYAGAVDAPLPVLVSRAELGPLVLLTLGTVRSRPRAMAAAVAGLAELPVRVVATVGPQGDPAALGEQPPRVAVVRWVDQAALLPHCSVVVSHTGSGTFLGALAAGLPQVGLPQGADQFRNAAGVTATGTGLVVEPGSASPAAVRDAVAEVLGDPAYAAAAARVAEEIRDMPTPAEVVAELTALP